MTLEWMDPPRQARKSTVAVEVELVVAQLKDRPWQWAKVFTGGRSGAQARRKLYVEAGCQVAGSGGALYVRWCDV